MNQSMYGSEGIVRVATSAETRRARPLARRPPGQGRDWHVARTDLLPARLDELDLDDFVVDNDGGRTGREVAQQVLSRLEW